MSKKQNKPEQEIPAAPQPAPQAEPSEKPATVSKAKLWTMWGVIAATVVIARALDAMLPGVPERVIERWLMLAFGLFMAFFLYRL
jgi:hypothetical protein